MQSITRTRAAQTKVCVVDLFFLFFGVVFLVLLFRLRVRDRLGKVRPHIS